jgi:hypothetical protein
VRVGGRELLKVISINEGPAAELNVLSVSQETSKDGCVTYDRATQTEFTTSLILGKSSVELADCGTPIALMVMKKNKSLRHTQSIIYDFRILHMLEVALI